MKPIRVIVNAADLPVGRTCKFEFERAGQKVEGFVANFGGKIVAYENVCQHLSVTLDYDDNRFFTKDGRHFVCQTHGALYEPTTGLCVRGPCEGASLKPLPIEVRDGAVYLMTG